MKTINTHTHTHTHTKIHRHRGGLQWRRCTRFFRLKFFWEFLNKEKEEKTKQKEEGKKSVSYMTIYGKTDRIARKSIMKSHSSTNDAALPRDGALEWLQIWMATFSLDIISYFLPNGLFSIIWSHIWGKVRANQNKKMLEIFEGHL